MNQPKLINSAAKNLSETFKKITNSKEKIPHAICLDIVTHALGYRNYQHFESHQARKSFTANNICELISQFDYPTLLGFTSALVKKSAVSTIFHVKKTQEKYIESIQFYENAQNKVVKHILPKECDLFKRLQCLGALLAYSLDDTNDKDLWAAKESVKNLDLYLNHLNNQTDSVKDLKSIDAYKDLRNKYKNAIKLRRTKYKLTLKCRIINYTELQALCFIFQNLSLFRDITECRHLAEIILDSKYAIIEENDSIHITSCDNKDDILATIHAVNLVHSKTTSHQ